MQFIDEVEIYIKAGDGGNGCISFRREKFIPRGGPNGGDGGKGGNVIGECTADLNTLLDFKYQKHFIAKNGDSGKGSDKNGQYGKDLVIKIPLGTQIFFEDQETLYTDLTQDKQQILLAQGGNGGFGNTHFKSSINQAPRRANQGLLGEEYTLFLKLKLLSDVGIIGLPNAGKSTLLSVVSKAKPKIADYPFTTLKPQLGVTAIDNYSFVIADLPGLIEDASKDKGLGHRFLKHTERCGVLLHLIDCTNKDIAKDYKTIRKELKNYSKNLASKKEVVALNKCDLISKEELDKKIKELTLVYKKSKILTISGATNKGITELLRELAINVKKYKNESKTN